MATKIGHLAQELSRLNPWWRDPNWATVDPDLRDAVGTGLTYRPDVLSGLLPGCLYVLRDPRRVGKTVAVKQQIEDLITQGVPPTCIVPLAVDGWVAKELRTVVQNTAPPPVPPGRHRIWFIDEISAVAGEWDVEGGPARRTDVRSPASCRGGCCVNTCLLPRLLHQWVVVTFARECCAARPVRSADRGHRLVPSPPESASEFRQSNAPRPWRIRGRCDATPDQVARHHLIAIVAASWPGGVLCGRTALAGGVPVDGVVFVAHPDPPLRPTHDRGLRCKALRQVRVPSDAPTVRLPQIH